MEFIRYLHIISGIVIALSGLAQIILKKGGKLHRSLGVCYFAAWPIIVATGAVLGSLLITLFGVLGFYMALTGYRFGHLKSVNIGLFDKIIIYIGLLCGLSTLGLGLYYLIGSNFENIFGYIGCFFGLIFSFSTFQDMRAFIWGQKTNSLHGHKLYWYFEHFTRMYISYIAAMTAFTVINAPFPIPILNWILPTIIGMGLIIVSTRYYKKRLKVTSQN